MKNIYGMTLSDLENFVIGNMLAKEIYNEVLKLPFKESKIICMRYGLEDGKFRTLEEIGKEFGISRERVRQIELKAIRKLKNSKKLKAVNGYTDEIKIGFNNLVEESMENSSFTKNKKF